MAWRTDFQKVSSRGDPSLSAPVVSKTKQLVWRLPGFGDLERRGRLEATRLWVEQAEPSPITSTLAPFLLLLTGTD